MYHLSSFARQSNPSQNGVSVTFGGIYSYIGICLLLLESGIDLFHNLGFFCEALDLTQYCEI